MTSDLIEQTFFCGVCQQIRKLIFKLKITNFSRFFGGQKILAGGYDPKISLGIEKNLLIVPFPKSKESEISGEKSNRFITGGCFGRSVK